VVEEEEEDADGEVEHGEDDLFGDDEGTAGLDAS
jgi:hypothetical protein